MDIIVFKILPPKNSETSRISEFIKGLKNLQMKNIKTKQISVRYIILSQAPVEELFTIIVEILIIIIILIIVINKAQT